MYVHPTVFGHFNGFQGFISCF